MTTIRSTDPQLILAWTTILSRGGVVLFPSDSSYGLAVDAMNETAIARVFSIKKRESKPLSIVVKNKDDAQKYVVFEKTSERLWDKLIPGPVTIILTKRTILPDNLTCGKNSVGIRIPDYKLTQKLADSYPNPYTATSANVSGQPPAYSIDDALSQLNHDLIDLVIDAGILPHNPPSTVIDATQNPPVILRKGLATSI